MTHAQFLDVMLMARKRMTQCIDRFDALAYNPHDRSFTELGLDQLVLETMSTLRRFYLLHSGLNPHIP